MCEEVSELTSAWCCVAGIQYSVVYSLVEWFRVEAGSGRVFTTARLDREQQQFVLLGVRATTTGTRVLYSTAQVRH